MVRILAVDPGREESGAVVLDTDGGKVVWHAIEDNEAVRSKLLHGIYGVAKLADVLVLEKVESYGMPVGDDVFETIYQSGQIAHAAKMRHIPVHRIPRRDVKMHLCGNMRARDSNIRQAIINRYGGKQKAIGRKASPGPLYGIKSHEWAALALALTYWDREVPRIEARKGERDE